MPAIDGYVKVYESSDGGSGDAHQTFWQFHVDDGNNNVQPVTTKNSRLADTMRFAAKTSSRVRVAYDDKNIMSQARIEFSYTCELLKLNTCYDPANVTEPKEICIAKRYSPCKPSKTGKARSGKK